MPEAFRLVEDVGAMAHQRRQKAKAAFAAVARRVVGSAGPQSCPTDDPSLAIGRWYSKLDITCPLLFNGLCDSYPKRPIACREHMVSTPPVDCAGFKPADGSAIQLRFSVLELLCELTAEMEGEPPEAVMMPIALEWAGLHPGRAERAWPARELFGRFADRVNEMLAAAPLADSAAA